MIRAPFRATTHDLIDLSPLRADNGTGLDGVSLGSLHRGRNFVFDPFDAYRSGLVTGPNMVILGRIGSGKSAAVKMMLRRALLGGASVAVLDPKGEYTPLAQQCHGQIFTLGDAGWFDIRSGSRQEDVRVLCALLSLARGHALSDVEAMTVESLWRESNAETQTRPIKYLLELSQRNGDIAIASTLHRFVDGDLGGLIDGHGEPQSVTSTISVLNLERWWGTDALAAVSMLAWVIAERTLAQGRKGRYLVADEAWSLLDAHASLMRLRGSLKLARASGTSHILVLHRLADLEVVGDVGSRHYAAALSLLRDCDTHLVFQTSEGDVGALAKEFHLTDREQRYVTALPRGAALVRYGPHRSIVRFQPTREDLIDTDRAMR